MTLTFPVRLVEWRKDLKLTQDDAARILGVNRAQLAQWEIGRAYPSLTTFARLVERSGRTADWWLWGP